VKGISNNQNPLRKKNIASSAIYDIRFENYLSASPSTLPSSSSFHLLSPPLPYLLLNISFDFNILTVTITARLTTSSLSSFSFTWSKLASSAFVASSHSLASPLPAFPRTVWDFYRDLDPLVSHYTLQPAESLALRQFAAVVLPSHFIGPFRV